MKNDSFVLDKKKLCLITTNLYVVKFFLLPHLKHLSKIYEISLIVNTESLEDFSEMELSHVKIIDIPIRRDISVISDCINIFRLCRILLKEKPDVVQSIAPKAGLIGMFSSWIVRIPIRIHVFQGEVWANRKGFLKLILKSVDTFVAKMATQLLVVSRTERAFLAQQKVSSLEKMSVLGQGSISGVDLETFKPDPKVRSIVRKELGYKEDDIIVLYLGRLNRDKGIMDMVHAMCAQENINNAKLLVVGPDEHDLRQEIERVSTENKLSTKVLPYVETPSRYLCAADFIVLPSYREGFGVVILEAGACSIPAIGSNIYGIQDAIIDGKTGLLYEVGNVFDLSQKIKILISDKSFRENLGKNALLRVVNEFSQESVMREYLNFHKSLWGAIF